MRTADSASTSSQDGEVTFNDLGGDGDTPDTDNGGNGLQNYPYLNVSSRRLTHLGNAD